MQKPALEESRWLSVEDRLQLLEDVWTSLDEEQDRLPMAGWHEEELERRLMSFEDNPGAGSPWPEVKKRLLKRGRRGRERPGREVKTG